MKKTLLFALVLAWLGAVAVARPARKSPTDARQEVEALERQRFAAQVAKDYAFLEKVFADDLIYTHASGKQNGKTDYIQSIRDGKSQYDKIDV